MRDAGLRIGGSVVLLVGRLGVSRGLKNLWFDGLHGLGGVGGLEDCMLPFVVRGPTRPLTSVPCDD